MKSWWLFGLVLMPLVAFGQGRPLVVHEWGTFTSLQDEAGQTIGAINTDDEPVPQFCHDLSPLLIKRLTEAPPSLSKGVPACLPEVTMRLETPVVYFHLPPGVSGPMKASVKVAFKGGWLTQFYPAAESPGLPTARLSESSIGTLAWNDLKIGSNARGPETKEKVWTAPRQVEAAGLLATNGESEKFLFYRGVGHLPCPLQVRRTSDGKMLEGRAQLSSELAGCGPMIVSHAWLVWLDLNGRCAFRQLGPLSLAAGSNGGKLFSTAAEFSRNESSGANLTALRAQMLEALVGEGLYKDEAAALLNTWEVSYFKNGGLRLFFMVPRAWTDFYLPLEVSVPSEIKRAMIGRLELITPSQRKLLQQLAQSSIPTRPWAEYKAEPDAYLLEGTMPEAYRSLGRFREALVLAENRAHPTPSLSAFIRLNGLGAGL